MIKISNIKSIVSCDIDSNKILYFNNESIYLKKEKIFKITNEDLPFDYEIDAQNTIITPGFVDCHTHPIFISDRAKEFNLRTSGLSYEEINSKGGGINSSVLSLREEDENSL